MFIQNVPRERGNGSSKQLCEISNSSVFDSLHYFFAFLENSRSSILKRLFRYPFTYLTEFSVLFLSFPLQDTINSFLRFVHMFR